MGAYAASATARARFADPDASWGHRSAVATRKGGGFHGYKIDAAVCTNTGLPVTWIVRTASEAETTFALPLIHAGSRARIRGQGCHPTRAMTTSRSTRAAWTAASGL